MMHRLVYTCFMVVMVTGSLLAQKPDWSFLTPQLGGTLRLGLANEDNSLWLSDCETIKEKREANGIKFILKDSFFEKGKIEYIIRNLDDSKGAIMKIKVYDLPDGMRLIWAYGGASNEEPSVKSSSTGIMPADCNQNVFSIEGNSFTLYYGTSRRLRILEGLTPQGQQLRLADARKQDNPITLLHSGKKTNAQVLASEVELVNGNDYYFCFYFLSPKADYNYFMLPQLFENGHYRVNEETEWMKSTPD